jgi:hypothetical protein
MSSKQNKSFFRYELWNNAAASGIVVIKNSTNEYNKLYLYNRLQPEAMGKKLYRQGSLAV